MMNKQIVAEQFYTTYQSTPTLIVRSPGRVNIIGEHTDYNEGFVLPAAINKAAFFAVALNDTNTINIAATDLKESYNVLVDAIQPTENLSWANYVIGAVAQFKKLGVTVPGFNALLTSNLPIGAGLSSSAAVECAVIFALNELLATNLDKYTMVKMAQATEHEYAGVHCGIMDMFASMFGKKNNVIKLDCKTLDYEYVPFVLEGIKLVLLNTSVKHSLASSEYNTRSRECKQAVNWVKEYVPNVQSLRDVSLEMLDKYVLPKSALIDSRSRFVVQEIQRLQDGCVDLLNGNLSALGKKIYATHLGLSSMYEVSCKELDFLIEEVKSNEAVIGARMMGGGFGGCTINLVKADAIEELLAKVQPAYEAAMQLPLSYYVVDIEDGTSVL